MAQLVNRKNLMESLAKLQEIRKGSARDSNEYPGYSKPTTPFRPYIDYYVNLENNPYENEDESVSDVEEGFISKFIDTLLANQALSLASNKEYHEEFDGRSAFAQEKIPDIYKVRPNSDSNCLYNERLPRKKTRHGRQGRSRRSKFDEEIRVESMFADLPVGSELTVKEGTLMISLPVDLLRQYMYSEVEARVWNVNAYYKREWETINRERMTTLAELVKVQETSRKMKSEMEEMVQTMRKYKEMCDNLGTKVETSKEAKRRRRQAKKQRKTEKPTQTGAGDGSGGDNDLDLDPSC